VFFGRVAELHGLCQALGSCRVVTLVGPPGVGKSRLAAQLAGAPRFDVVHRAGLARLRATELLAGAREVCADGLLPDVRGPLERLVGLSLIVRDGERYRMPATIRAYGAQMLDALGEAAELRNRHDVWHRNRTKT
jgi:hypothetical protein